MQLRNEILQRPTGIYKKILQFFHELITLHAYSQQQDIILSNNKEILVDWKPVSFSEWFKRGNISIKDLLDEKGNFIIFDEFFRKFSCKITF